MHFYGSYQIPKFAFDCICSSGTKIIEMIRLSLGSVLYVSMLLWQGDQESRTPRVGEYFIWRQTVLHRWRISVAISCWTKLPDYPDSPLLAGDRPADLNGLRRFFLIANAIRAGMGENHCGLKVAARCSSCRVNAPIGREYLLVSFIHRNNAAIFQ